MPEKRAKKKTVSRTTEAPVYPSREKLANLSSTKEINAALTEVAQEFGINSASWAARRAIMVYLKLRPLDALLQKVKPEHLPALREALTEIVGESE